MTSKVYHQSINIKVNRSFNGEIEGLTVDVQLSCHGFQLVFKHIATPEHTLVKICKAKLLFKLRTYTKISQRKARVHSCAAETERPKQRY